MPRCSALIGDIIYVPYLRVVSTSIRMSHLDKSASELRFNNETEWVVTSPADVQPSFFWLERWSGIFSQEAGHSLSHVTMT